MKSLGIRGFGSSPTSEERRRQMSVTDELLTNHDADIGTRNPSALEADAGRGSVHEVETGTPREID